MRTNQSQWSNTLHTGPDMLPARAMGSHALRSIYQRNKGVRPDRRILNNVLYNAIKARLLLKSKGDIRSGRVYSNQTDSIPALSCQCQYEEVNCPGACWSNQCICQLVWLSSSCGQTDGSFQSVVCAW